jgi:hypothetical protein
VLSVALSPELLLAENYRQQTVTLSAAYMRNALALWPLLRSEGGVVDWQSVDPWLRLSNVLVRLYRDRSALLSQQYAQRARLVATGSPRGPVSLPDRMPVEQVVRTFRYTGPATIERSRYRGLDDHAARQRALTLTLQAGQRLVLDAGRDVVDKTVRADDAAVGWMRVTDADPCAFCAILASRGAVYKSAESAGVEESRKRAETPHVPGTIAYETSDDWHNGCGCQVVPVFSRDAEMPETSKRADDLWKRAAKGLSGSDAVNAFRRAVEGRSLPDDPINQSQPTVAQPVSQ